MPAIPPQPLALIAAVVGPLEQKRGRTASVTVSDGENTGLLIDLNTLNEG
jgi:hypothetical protein